MQTIEPKGNQAHVDLGGGTKDTGEGDKKGAGAKGAGAKGAVGASSPGQHRHA